MKNYVTRPAAGAMNEWAKWIDQQPVKRWRIVTLEYPRWSNLNLWRQTIKHTMRELEQSFLKHALAWQNKASGADHLRRVVMMGGSKEHSIALHAHCLIDGIGDDQKFKKKLDAAWMHNVRKTAVDGGYVFHKAEAITYSRPAVGGTREYMHYCVRHEGSDLKFGVDKVEVPLTYLT